MAAPFVVEGPGVPGTQVWSVDASGNTVQSGNLTVAGNTSLGTVTYSTSTVTTMDVTGTLYTQGVINANNGYSSAGSVNFLSGNAVTANGTATISPGTGGTQLADITRDYMLYLGCTTTGGATVLIGPTATATAATIFVGSALTAGTSGVISVRVPAAWYTRITGTTAVFGNQVIVSC